MNVKELKELLAEYDDDMEVLIYDEDDYAREITATEVRRNPHGKKDFVMLCVDYEWETVIGDLI